MCNRSLKHTAISLSSCQAEFYAASACAWELLGLAELFKKLHCKVSVRLEMDPDSARHILQRRGQGRLKHIEIRCLSIQQWIRDKRLSVSRVDTKNNTADLFTKHLDGFRSRALAKKLGLRFVDMADGGTNGNGRWWQLTAFNKRLQLSRCVSFFSFDMWSDCTLHRHWHLHTNTVFTLPLSSLLFVFFFFSLSTDRYSSVVQYSSWLVHAHGSNRPWVSFCLCENKRSSDCHLDNFWSTTLRYCERSWPPILWMQSCSRTWEAWASCCRLMETMQSTKTFDSASEYTWASTVLFLTRWWSGRQLMEFMSTMKGQNLRATLESVFVIRKENWDLEPSTAGSWEKGINSTGRSRWESKHVWACEGQGTSKALRAHERRQSHEATHCPFRAWCEICVKAKSPDGKHAKQVVNLEHILVIEFDYAFATHTPGGPRISMMVATESIHGSVFADEARRKRGQDDYVMQSFQNYIDRLGLVEAELKCDQEPSTLDVANALIKRCQSTALIVTATPKGSKGSLRRRERANLIIQGQLRAFREAVSMKYKTEVGPDHVLMGWMVRHCAWVVNNFQVKGTGRTPYRSLRSKDYTGEVVPFGDVCLGRNFSEDGAKWIWGVFVGKLDRTDEFLLLLTPTDAMKTRCVRRLEGDNCANFRLRCDTIDDSGVSTQRHDDEDKCAKWFETWDGTWDVDRQCSWEVRTTMNN